jgi:Tol biopolymer transport system component
MKEIGRTGYDVSTCSNSGTASTITGQSIAVYGVNKCNLTERTDACTSPDGNYRVITNFVKGVGWTVNLENVTDGSSQWYYQGNLNRDIGIQWSPNSRYAIFGVQNAITVIPIGGDLRQLVDFLSTDWPPQFSPDGSVLYYLKPVGSAGASDVFAVNMDTGASWNMTNAPNAHKMCPRWRR